MKIEIPKQLPQTGEDTGYKAYFITIEYTKEKRCYEITISKSNGSILRQEIYDSNFDGEIIITLPIKLRIP